MRVSRFAVGIFEPGRPGPASRAAVATTWLLYTRFGMRGALALTVAAALSAAGIAAAAVTPNDPGWPGEWGLRLIGLPSVWPADAATHPVIATVDTGANADFPDLKQVVVSGWNLLDNTANSSDTAGHGTDVALVIAANQGNSYGLAGACPMCRVMPVKISTDGTATAKLVAAGIRWAVDNGSKVITISIAAPGPPDPDEQAAVDYAGARGAVVFAAAGNDGSTTMHYPAALRGVVSIAGTDENDALYPWSSRGSWVDLAAPGCIYGDTMCGTSYGPPLVAAAVGVLMSASPSVTAVQAVNALRATAVHIPGIAGGRIDVHAAAIALGIPLTSAAPGGSQPQGRREVTVQGGAFARNFSTTLTVGAGPLTVLFTRANASRCSMSLRSGNALYLTWRSTPNELDISTRVAAGRYTLAVHCAGKRALPYSLNVNALSSTR